MRSIFDNWAKAALILLPLCIIGIDAGVLLRERSQTDAQKATRLVRESRSRKEGFTVQQYLYTTVYHREIKGEEIRIDGWRADSKRESVTTVEFSYEDGSGRHVSVWEVDTRDWQVTPLNEDANELSWH